jgi:hypothetical protein
MAMVAVVVMATIRRRVTIGLRLSLAEVSLVPWWRLLRRRVAGPLGRILGRGVLPARWRVRRRVPCRIYQWTKTCAAKSISKYSLQIYRWTKHFKRHLQIRTRPWVKSGMNIPNFKKSRKYSDPHFTAPPLRLQMARRDRQLMNWRLI